MAEVKKNNGNKAKKSSKVLDKNVSINNDELLEQILNKKRNKTQKSIAPRRKNTTGSTSTKKINKKNDEISSDLIYEQIKAKKSTKKKTTSKSIDKLEVNKDISDDVLKNFSKAFLNQEEKNNEDDLIITREIRFDDLSSNLKNKKTLKELKDAIEEFDKLNDNDLKNDFNDDIDILPSIRYSNYKVKKILVILGIIMLCVAFVVGICFGVDKISDNISYAKQLDYEEQKLIDEKKKQEERQRKLKLYNDCLNRHYTDADMTDDMLLAVNNLKSYLKDNYIASVSYEDLNYGYNFSYNENEVYYAASTIKALDALYIYQAAAEGKINLDDTVTYTSKFKVSYSEGVKKHKIGSKISLRMLVKYAVIYSDNSAHQMLVSYIGRSKLKEFGKSLGAKNTLVGGDNFGNISSGDGLIYMKAINNFIENNGKLGEELKSFFVEAAQKEIVVNNLTVANKYGLYKKNYHNMGIIYDESPYIVSIMTLEGYKDEESIVNNISKKVYELHSLYKTNRENVCKIEIYGNEKSTID